MEDQTNSDTGVPENPKEESQAVVSRRRLLKTAAVASGAVAASAFLPEKWSRPVVEAGELSVHAAASPAAVLRISNLEVTDYEVELTSSGISGTGQFDFEDSLAAVRKDNSSLLARLTSSGISGSADEAVDADVEEVHGEEETTGQVIFNFFASIDLVDAPSIDDIVERWLHIKLRSNGRTSNEESDKLDRR